MGKHTKNKKINKKKIILLFIILLFLILTASILIKIRNTNNLKTEVAQTINNTFRSLKEGNIEESKKYLDYNSLISILDKEILSEENLLKYELNKELFNLLEWNIKEIDIQENNINVIIEIKNKDYSQIIMKWLELIVKEEENGNTLTNEQCAEKMKEVILNDEIEMATEIRKITLKHENEKSQIVVNEEFGNGIFPKIEKLNEVLTEIE